MFLTSQCVNKCIVGIGACLVILLGGGWHFKNHTFATSFCRIQLQKACQIIQQSHGALINLHELTVEVFFLIYVLPLQVTTDT